MTSPAQPKIAIVEVERLRVAMWPCGLLYIVSKSSQTLYADLGLYFYFSIILASALS